MSLEDRVLDLARKEGILRPRDLTPFGIPTDAFVYSDLLCYILLK